jgi:hypothetical protein
VHAVHRGLAIGRSGTNMERKQLILTNHRKRHTRSAQQY